MLPHMGIMIIKFMTAIASRFLSHGCRALPLGTFRLQQQQQQHQQEHAHHDNENFTTASDTIATATATLATTLSHPYWNEDSQSNSSNFTTISFPGFKNFPLGVVLFQQ